MVHRGKRKVRPSGQEETSSIEGAVSEVEDCIVVPECKPTSFQTIQDNLCTVVREKRITIFPPDHPDRRIEIKSGDIFYNLDYGTAVEYTLVKGMWRWASAKLGEEPYFKHRDNITGWKSIYRAILVGELVPVKNRELVTLSFLTGENHVKAILEKRKKQNATRNPRFSSTC